MDIDDLTIRANRDRGSQRYPRDYAEKGHLKHNDDQQLSRGETLFFWTVITVGIAVWSGFLFVAGYSIGAGS